MNRMIARLRDKCRGHSDEIYRIGPYLIVGGWNALFGIGVYAILYKLNTHVNYLVLMIPANILVITHVYLGYKIVVPKTRGNYLQEYLRCCGVYSGVMILGFALMCLLVSILGMHPIPAQLLPLILFMICNYIGHKCYSFEPTPASKFCE